MSYNFYEHGLIIADRRRLAAYRKALKQSLQGGEVVVDLGAGTGIMSFYACQLGARRVYAIETNDIIQVAGELARANGFADRIEFIQALSLKVSLPEPAQVIVADLRGRLPFFGSAIPSLVDARRRFLTPGGTLIPYLDRMWGAVLTAPETYRHLTEPWEGRRYRLNLAAGRQLAVNSFYKIQARSGQLLTEAKPWAVIDYTTVESPHADGELHWEVRRAGTGHGFALWFNAELVPGVNFSNAPGGPGTLYGQSLFPWPEPVALDLGDTISVSLEAHLVGSKYLWRWDTKVLARGIAGSIKADFCQSTYHGILLTPANLQRQAAGHVAILSEEGQVDRFILIHMDGRRTLDEITTLVMAEFPDHFASRQEALTRVGQLSVTYSLPPKPGKF